MQYVQCELVHWDEAGKHIIIAWIAKIDSTIGSPVVFGTQTWFVNKVLK